MLKKGDKVVMHTCGEAEHYKGKIWFCKSDEFTSSAKQQVVFLEGFSGYFLVDYLQKLDLSGYRRKPAEGELTVSDIEYKIQARMEWLERNGAEINLRELSQLHGWILCGDKYTT